MNDTAEQEAHSHDQKKVRENTTKHRGLDELNFVSLESNNADLYVRLVVIQEVKLGALYNKFHGISKGSVQESTKSLTKLHRELFCRKRQNSSEWDNSEEVDGENGSGAPAHLASDNTERYHDKKKVDIV
jgi:predicted molibdopterin-dependent oxidoreductase YjgC